MRKPDRRTASQIPGITHNNQALRYLKEAEARLVMEAITDPTLDLPTPEVQEALTSVYRKLESGRRGALSLDTSERNAMWLLSYSVRSAYYPRHDPFWDRVDRALMPGT